MGSNISTDASKISKGYITNLTENPDSNSFTITGPDLTSLLGFQIQLQDGTIIPIPTNNIIRIYGDPKNTGLVTSISVILPSNLPPGQMVSVNYTMHTNWIFSTDLSVRNGSTPTTQTTTFRKGTNNGFISTGPIISPPLRSINILKDSDLTFIFYY